MKINLWPPENINEGQCPTVYELLEGKTYDFLSNPLGLTGHYVIDGLREIWVDHEFHLILNPKTTAFDILLAAAKEHKRIFKIGDHTFFESMEIEGNKIHFFMGS